MRHSLVIRPRTRLTEPQETANHRPGQVKYDLSLGHILLRRVAIRAGTSVREEERLNDEGGDSEPFGVREGPRGDMIDLPKLDGRGRQQGEGLCVVASDGKTLDWDARPKPHVRSNRSGTPGW
jgi:hypothetical protein